MVPRSIIISTCKNKIQKMNYMRINAIIRSKIDLETYNLSKYFNNETATK